MSRVFKFNVPNITCGSCIEIIENFLKSDESISVSHVNGDSATKEVTIYVENDDRTVEQISESVSSILAVVDMMCTNFEEILETKPDIAVTASPVAVMQSTADITSTQGEKKLPPDFANAEATSETTLILDEEGMPAQPAMTEEPFVTLTPDKKRIKKRKSINPLVSKILKASIGILAGAAIIGVMLSGIVIPPIGMYAMVGASSLLTLLLGYESYRATFYNLKNLRKEKKLTMDVLYSLSSLVIVGSMIAGLFYHFMPMMMEAGLWIFGFKYAGKVGEELLNRKTIHKVKLEELAAKKVWRKKNESDEWEKDVDAGDIQVGDIIQVAHGEKIPVNGTLLTPSAWLREKVVNGAVDAKQFAQGEFIYAGTKIPKKKDNEANQNEAIILRVTHTRNDSYYAAIEKQAKLNKQKKSKLENNAARYLKIFIPAVIVASVVSGILIGVFISPPLGIRFAVSVLATFCPCVLGTSMATSMWLGIKKGENVGVKFKDSKALERGSDITTVVFDLNKTLTQGKLTVKEFDFYDDGDTRRDRFFSIVAAIQRQGKHQFARKIAEYAEKESKGKYSYQVTNVDFTITTGIKATVDGDEYLIGNREFLKHHLNAAQYAAFQEIDRHIIVNGAEQITYIVRNNCLIGHCKIEDPLRRDAKFVVGELQAMGKEVHICTGADETVASRYAAMLGINPAHVYANSVGHPIAGNDRTKDGYVQSLKAQNKRVAMIGDGENDSSAMAASHFSVAMSRKSDKSLACKHARATVANDNLLPVLSSFVIAEQSVRSAKMNLLISLTYNLTAALVLGGLMIGIGFAINPAIGVALMVVQATLVLIIQYGIYKKKMAHMQRYKDSVKNEPEPQCESGDLFKMAGLLGKPGMRKSYRSEGASEQDAVNEKTPLLSPANQEQQEQQQESDDMPSLAYSGLGNRSN